MKKIIIASFLAFVSLSAVAQKNTNININNESINNTLTGKWTLANAQPNTKEVLYNSFEMKGPGYGNVDKVAGDKTSTIISKISAINNSEILFSDEEGIRTIYKVQSIGKTQMVLLAGKSVLTYTRK